MSGAKDITPQNFPGIAPDDVIARQIQKPDGALVTLFQSGSVTVTNPGQSPRTRTRQGHLWILLDGQPQQTLRKKSLLPGEIPLNIVSTSPDEIGRLMSNFAERRFTLHGKSYRSIEGWYQGLKWPDAKNRAAAARLFGPEARHAAKGAPAAGTFVYEGIDYRFGSPEHHQLIKTAIRASLDQNPALKTAFLATHPRPIIHQTGRPDPPTTSLPSEKFAQLLEEIRREFLQ
jgi:predicted NAD-dependent protein-ADP-ribosyltransferase YbiA (DUF1768 family)